MSEGLINHSRDCSPGAAPACGNSRAELVRGARLSPATEACWHQLIRAPGLTEDRALRHERMTSS